MVVGRIMLVRSEQPKVSREADFPAWVLDQAKILRRLKPHGLDWEDLAEQLDEMYAQIKVDLESDLRVILQHLLKLQFQPGENELRRRARGWRVSVIEHRSRVASILEDSRSLRKGWTEFIPRAYASARKQAAQHIGVEERSLPTKCPWSSEQILDPDFFPERGPSANGHRR